MDRLFRSLLGILVRRGNLRVTTASGATFRCGDGTGRPVAVRFLSRAAQGAAVLGPGLKVGEAYLGGPLSIDRGPTPDVLELVLPQPGGNQLPGWTRPQWVLRYLRRRFAQRNRPTNPRRNVTHHYDPDGRLYSLFPDADRQYSCGYFEA